MVVYKIGKAIAEKKRREAQEAAQQTAQVSAEHKPVRKSFVGKAWSYAAAVARWTAAGQPRRTEEEQQVVMATCKACPLFEPHPKKPESRPGKCGLCGCKLNLKSGKIAWATEQCPDDPPRWLATVGPLAETPSEPGAPVNAPAQEAPSKPHRTKAERIAARNERLRRRAERKAQAGSQAAKPPEPPQPAPEAPRGQSRAEKKAERAKAKAERIEKRRITRLAMGGETPPLAAVKPVEDPLLMYDRAGQPIGHVLRGMWQGSAAFYVCGGPSLKTLDLSFLKERGILSLGINNVGGYAPVRAWTFSDPAEKFSDRIFFDPTILKFVPKPKLGNRVRTKLPDGTFQWTQYNVNQCPSVFAYDRETHFYPEQFLTTTWASWGPSAKHKENQGKPTVLFTFFLGLRLLHYLGVKRVYLLGVDFGMSPERHYAFGQYRHSGAISGNNNSYRVATMLLSELKPYFDAAGFEVYQTNPDSQLRVFDYAPLEFAIDDCRGLVGREPYDLEGWYEKLDPHGQPKRDDQPDDRGE
jgi:hypothetical protein